MSYDAGLPVPDCPVDASGRRAAVSGWEVFSLGDQHAFVRISAETEIEPGDLVGLGISHPCTTFDKWSRLERIDDHGIVTGHITTTFG